MKLNHADSRIFYAALSPQEIQWASVEFGGPTKILGPEVERAEAFTQPKDREAFIGSRILLRLLLSYVEFGELAQASEVRISRHCLSCQSTAHGKPTTPRHAISSARTSELVIAAVAPNTLRLGIDIERGASLHPPGVFPGFDQLVLSASEQRMVGQDNNSDEKRLLAWTAKEALLKADGAGLRREPSTVPVLSPAVLNAARRARWARARHLAGLSLHWLPVPATHVAVIAASQPLPVQDLSAQIFSAAPNSVRC